MSFAGPIARLVNEFARLPGLGPKSAQRIVFHLLTAAPEKIERLITALQEAQRSIKRCSVCCNLTDVDPCAICRNPERNRSVLLVVESPRDVAALEKTRGYKGVYHVLHGALAPARGIDASALTLEHLFRRVRQEKVQEVIIATNPTIEGDATALYIAENLQGSGVKVTRLAYGLPVGAALEYTDEITLSRALEGRREIK